MVTLMDETDGVNPQEATTPGEGGESGQPIRTEKTPHEDDNDNRKTKITNGKSNHAKRRGIDKHEASHLRMKKRKVRNRVAHVASITGEGNSDSMGRASPVSSLPHNQYKATLIRRAIRQRGDRTNPSSPARKNEAAGDSHPSKKEDGDNDNTQDEYGDVSVGMKLSVIRGKIIVQHLSPLSDGRVSPAQAAGLIKRGDVLLAIDNVSLVNLSVHVWQERLRPLSSPDASGAYKRVLHLRFAAGEGLELLLKHEAAEARKANYPEGYEAASEVFSLFPMVDQLSGMPFDQMNIYSPAPAVHNQSDTSQRQTSIQAAQEQKAQSEDKCSEETSKENVATTDELRQRQLLTSTIDLNSLNKLISNQISYWQSFDRERFMSEFFAWNEKYSQLMRPIACAKPLLLGSDRVWGKAGKSKTEMVMMGQKALLGAQNLSRWMENIDRGKDMRSFRSWNSSISLRSSASTRRRYVLDAVSLPVRLDAKSAASSAVKGGSLATDATDQSEMEDLDGDELLLRLAAHDEIWRSQVIEALEEARDNLESVTPEASDNEVDKVLSGDIDSAMSKELGTFFFGETMAKIVTKKKKSKALPPAEITAVLFDLCTNLASTMPDEVDVGGKGGLFKSSLVPFLGRKRPEAGSSIILATRFILDEALVVWLETFRPLPWKSRRVLWPRSRVSPAAGESHAPSIFSDNDSLTLDADNGAVSPGSVYTADTAETGKHSKNLREQIEDQELDAETRAEACFLVTYYFTQRLLPKSSAIYPDDAAKKIEGGDHAEKPVELVNFVQKYGAYLKLHTSLAYAAALKRSDVIDALLELAEYDWRHREVIKLFSRRNSLILYEPTMLSAIVKCLPLIRNESSAERRQMLVDVCVSAFPDLCPWQVKQALVGLHDESHQRDAVNGGDLENLYYHYLSNLLHPHDGHDLARRDAALVEEWCSLSLSSSLSTVESGASSRRQNFFRVASRSSSEHRNYFRDLEMLLTLSMTYDEYDLALDLASEIVEDLKLSQREVLMEGVLKNIRKIARFSLKNKKEERQKQKFLVSPLKRSLRLFTQMSKSSSESCRKCVSVSDELFSLFEYMEKHGDGEILDLVKFAGNEAHPNDFLEALSTLTRKREMLSDTVHMLQRVLRRSSRISLNNELSGSLLRLRRARQRMKIPRESVESHEFAEDDTSADQTTWHLISRGLVDIDK